MPQVTCPRCGARQPVGDGDDGYTCTECRTAWMFAACENCGVRFHMRPGTTDWTCPECGHEHGSATMGEFEPEPSSAASPVEPVVAPARTGGRQGPPKRSGRRPPTRARLATIAVVGILAVIAVAYALSSLAASPSPSPSLTTTQQLCLHLRDLQTPREDALTRLADTLNADAVAIEAEGDTELTAAVLRMRRAVLDYRDALAAHGETSTASAEIADAYVGMPCG